MKMKMNKKINKKKMMIKKSLLMLNWKIHKFISSNRIMITNYNNNNNSNNPNNKHQLKTYKLRVSYQKVNQLSVMT